ncbi:STAS domain-containing protein [Crocosphaera sp.]|uniref:STAS domain-containing protein n=1 Tax=Crocosphaera sp. TaxID=2729996 RepID=UPI00261B4A86|nr:STAS domain-containing protein [Crocosphaera sp.]MDJ0578873.1 STAS domain-containing protein [Crocosphaera sp.]
MMGSLLTNLGVAVFEPSGYLTAANVDSFQQELTNFVTQNSYREFLVDMRQVEFIDSAGLMAIVSAFRLAQRLNKKLSVCCLSPSVRIIFELTQLDRALEIYESRQTYKVSLNETMAA